MAPIPSPSLLDVTSCRTEWIHSSQHNFSSSPSSPSSDFTASPYSPSPYPIDDSPHPHPSYIPIPSTSSSGLYPPPDPSLPRKKSHARRQPEGHVPRPRNAFILFRCDFVAQKKVPESVTHDHRHISRIAGQVWQGMTAVQRAPWVGMAKKEKEGHRERWPDYRYQKVGGKEKEGTEGAKGRGKGKRRRRGDGNGNGSMKVEGRGEIGVWEVVTNEDMEEELRKAEGEGDVEGLSPATTACEDPSVVPIVLGQRRSSSCPPPTIETTFDPGYGLWPTAVAEDGGLDQHGFVNNIGTPYSLPTQSMLLSGDHTWATSCPSSHQVHPREMNIPSSTQPLPASWSSFLDPFASMSLWHPVPYDATSSLQVSPHDTLPLSLPLPPHASTSSPLKIINDCPPPPPPIPIPESQNYTHAAFDWHLTTGVSDPYACSPIELEEHFRAPHEPEALNYGSGDGIHYTGMEEGTESYLASTGANGGFLGGNENVVGVGGVSGGVGDQSSLWASGCVARMPLPVPVPAPVPFVQACHNFMYGGMPVSISDGELRGIGELYITEDEGGFGGRTY